MDRDGSDGGRPGAAAFLRLYCWWHNALGTAAGILFGGLAAVLQGLLVSKMPESNSSMMTLISFAATIVVSLMTPETPHKVVKYFYDTTRPFGLWKPFWRELSGGRPDFMGPGASQ